MLKNLNPQTIKMLLKMAAPLMLANLINATSNFMIMLLISHLGQHELAAGALISSTLGMLNMLAIALIMPIGVIVGKHVGAERFQFIGQVVRAGLKLAAFISIPLAIFLLSIGFILQLFKQPPEVIGLVVSFCRALAYGTFPMFAIMVFGQFCMGISRPRIVMWVTGLSLPCNVLLSYALLFGKFGLPDLGIAGAGWASGAVSWLVFFGLLFYFYFRKIFQPYNLFSIHTTNLDNTNYLKQIFTTGWPICLQYGAELSAFTLITYWMGWLGVVALAAQQITMQWVIITLMITLAIGQATSVLVGQAYGREEIVTAKHMGFLGLILNVSYVFCVSLVFWFAPRLLTAVYISSAHPVVSPLFKIAAQLLAVSAVTQLFDSIRLGAASALRGFLDTRVPMLISMSACWLIAVPCAYGFAFRLHEGAVGLRWGGCMGVAVAALLMLWRFYKYQP